MRRLALCLFALLSPLAALAEGRSIIVLDGSGSMWGQIDGRPKLEIAREALGEVLRDLPAGGEVGLMAYGHREKGSCEDIELLVPPAQGTGPAIAAAANALQFKGKTPLSEAVRRAAAELRSTEEKATVILITDGIETCAADPCALGAELEASGVDFTAHVVGFGLSEDEGAQVACLANATGGLYLAAADLQSLSEALVEVVLEDPASVPAPAPEPVPEPVPEPEPSKALENNFDPAMLMAAGGSGPLQPDDGYFEVWALAADGSKAEKSDIFHGTRDGLLAPGRYLVQAVLGEARAETEIEVTADQLAQPVIVVNAAHLTVRLLASAGVETGDAGYWEILGNGPGNLGFGYGSASAYVPAGDYSLHATFGAAEVNEAISLKPGEVVTREVILGTGKVVLSSFYAEGLAVEDDQQFIEVFAAKADIQGNRTSVAYAYGPVGRFDLPPGDYVAQVNLGGVKAEFPFAATAGGELAVTAVLNAGVAAITAPGASFQEVFGAKADIAGNRKSFGYSYPETWQIALPAGDYILQATRGETKTETPFAVVAGERVEVKAP